MLYKDKNVQYKLVMLLDAMHLFLWAGGGHHAC